MGLLYPINTQFLVKTPEEIFGPYADKFMNDNKDWSPVTARD